MSWAETRTRQVAMSHAKLPLLILAAVTLWTFFPVLWVFGIENRTLRDALGLTPFDSVVITERELLTPDTLALVGTAIKRRCEFVGMSAVVEGLTGVSDRALVELRPADRTTKVPSELPQLWGPHVIHRPETIPVPIRWELWVSHLCPSLSPTNVGSMDVQTNLFASGPWSSM